MKTATPPTSDQLAAWDRQHVWHAFTQMRDYQPLVFERGEGCTLIDINGNRYLDGCSSLWCNIHGHAHPKIDAAIRAQLDKVAHVTNLGASNPTTIELAKRLVEITPEGLNHVFFVSDGACAIEAAVKIAFQYWRQCERPRPEKSVFLTLGDAYHGDTIGSVSLGGVDRFNAVFGPLLFETIRAPMPDMYRLSLPTLSASAAEGVIHESATKHYLAEVENILAAEQHRLAAMVIEPLVQGAAGMVMHPRGYLRGVRELTRKYNVLLIADEIAVGFGRTGTMFACEQEDVTPDLLCLGKGLTGGYLPVAATLASDEVYGAFLGDYEESKAFFHGHTYGGNPLGCAAGLATLDI
ncbi:MAG: adenosylmethionine--8-amino-7-oxononanoate transaminase, partial [Pirellulales bacterium]